MKSDVVIVGAGPVGLFAAFQLGLFGFRCSFIEALDRPGGQCAALYADKPIYDIPALRSVLAGELVDRLREQISPFDPIFLLGRAAVALAAGEKARWRVSIDAGDVLETQAVVLAAGIGMFRQVPDNARDNDAVQKDAGQHDSGPTAPAGPTLLDSPVAGWNVGFSDGLIPVDPSTFETRRVGIFAIGDIASYPGKLRLILSGFHEAALMAQAVRKIVRPGEKNTARRRPPLL